MSEKKSFWTTLPGIATGTATVISAVLGVIGVIRATNEPPAGQETSSSPASSNTSAANGAGSQDSRSVETAPVARLAPSILDFGEQGTGRTSATMIATLTNLGGAELNVEEVALAGKDASQFEITQNGCESKGALDPKNDCEIGVQFSPKAVGGARATLSVSHNGGDSPSEISLVGEGVLLQL